MFEQVKEILAKQLRVDASKITMDSKIKDDLGADSLDILQLLMAIEDKYNVTVPDEQLATFEKVSDIVSFLETLN